MNLLPTTSGYIGFFDATESFAALQQSIATLQDAIEKAKAVGK